MSRAELRLLSLEHLGVLIAGAGGQARALVVVGKVITKRDHALIRRTEAFDRVVETLDLDPLRFARVAEAEVGRRHVVEQRRLLDVEKAEVALAQLARGLERRDRFRVAAGADIDAAEAAVGTQQL